MHGPSDQEPGQRAAPSAPVAGERIGGRYVVEHRLGSGGMGDVFAARDGVGARVALKFLRAGDGFLAPEQVARFVREARAAEAIDSPHVVRILDAGGTDERGRPYFAMELLCGADLASLLRSLGSLDPAVVARLFVQACHGLAAAHVRGIVHRDVKPSNLFLHEPEPGAPLVVKVCDFGIAKARGLAGDGVRTLSELTETGGLLGSILYMAPEQLRDAKKVDARADVYSLGTALFEALAGRRPFLLDGTPTELILAVCTQDAPSLHAVAPWIGRDLSAVVGRALARDPEARYGSASELATALEPFAMPAEALTREAASRSRASSARSAEPSPLARTRTEPQAGHAADAPAPRWQPAERRRGDRRRPRALGAAVVTVGLTIAVALASGRRAGGASATSPETKTGSPGSAVVEARGQDLGGSPSVVASPSSASSSSASPSSASPLAPIAPNARAAPSQPARPSRTPAGPVPTAAPVPAAAAPSALRGVPLSPASPLPASTAAPGDAPEFVRSW